MCKNKGSKSYQANKDFLVALFSHSFNGNWEALSAAAAHFKEIDHKKKTDTNSEFKNKCGTDIELSELNDIIFSCRDGRNWTVLHFAAAGNNLDIIKQILLFSTKLVFIRDNTEELTPIMVAARYGHLEACQLIAKACPDCVFQISRGGKSLLHYAVEGKNVKCVKYFIDLNVNIHLVADSVGTASYWCFHNLIHEIVQRSEACNLEVERKLLEVLLEHKSCTLQPPDGFPPALCIAAAVGNVSIVKLLLQYGESLDQHDDDGWNPLHLAVEGGFVDVVATIVDHICNEKCYNVLNDLNKNKTPMNLAIDGGKENIIKLLKSVNALKAETEKKISLQCIDKVCQESEMRESHSVNDVLEEANALKHETIERKKEAHNFMSEWNEKVENEIQQKKEQANALFKAQSFNKAVDLYKEALSICPEINETQQVRAILYSNLSSTYRRLGNFEEALKAGLKASEINSRWYKGYFCASKAFEGIGNFEEAAQSMWEAVIQLSDEDPLKSSLRNSFALLVEKSKQNFKSKSNV